MRLEVVAVTATSDGHPDLCTLNLQVLYLVLISRRPLLTTCGRWVSRAFAKREATYEAPLRAHPER